MRCWHAVVSSKSSSYRIRVTRHSWPSPWRYGGSQPLLHLAMSPHGTDGPSPIQKSAAGIVARHYFIKPRATQHFNCLFLPYDCIGQLSAFIAPCLPTKTDKPP